MTDDKHGERIAKLEQWQVAQNGRLKRIEHKQDQMTYLLLSTLAAAVVSLLLQLFGGA